MSRLTAAEILAHTTMPEEVVSVPEWGGDILVRGLTKGQSQALIKASQSLVWEGGKSESKLDNDKFELALFGASVADPAFAPDEIPLLAGVAAGPFNAVNKVAMRLNGMTPDGKTSQGAADDAQKSVPPVA